MQRRYLCDLTLNEVLQPMISAALTVFWLAQAPIRALIVTMSGFRDSSPLCVYISFIRLRTASARFGAVESSEFFHASITALKERVDGLTSTSPCSNLTFGLTMIRCVCRFSSARAGRPAGRHLAAPGNNQRRGRGEARQRWSDPEPTSNSQKQNKHISC